MKNNWKLRRRYILAVRMLALWLFAIQPGFVRDAFGDADTPKFETDLLHQQAINESPTPLSVGSAVQRQIAGGESQHFSLSVSTGQFFTVHLEEHGAILLAKISKPSGEEILQMDTPAGPYGPIYFSAIASESATYQITITSSERWANRASYELVVRALRPSQPEDQDLIAAEKLFTEGRRLYRSGKISEALKNYEQSLRYWTERKDRHWQAVTTYAQVEAYRQSIERSKVEPTLTKTLEIVTTGMADNDWRLKAVTLNDLGSLYATRSDPKPAIELLTNALSLFGAHSDRRGQASSLNNLARVHDRLGNLTLARELLLKASQFRKEENDQGGVANLLGGLGVIADRLGEPDAALKYLTEAVNAWQKVEELRPSDKVRIAAAFNNLAAASEKLGQFNQVLAYYDEALSRFPPGDPNRAATLDNKGDFFASLGDPITATDCYNEALSILEKSGSDVVDIKAGVLIHMGQLAMNQGDMATALNRFYAARAVKPSPRQEANSLVNIGAALTLKGDLQEALECFRRALEIQSSLADARGQAITHQKRGEAYALLNKPKEAFDDFDLAKGLWKRLKDLQGESLVLNSIAKLQRDQGNIKEAAASSDEAITVVESLRTRLSSYQLRTSYFASQTNYFDLNIDLKMRMSISDSNPNYAGTALETSERARARVLLDTLNEALTDRNQQTNTADITKNELVIEIAGLRQRLRSKAQARTTLLNGKYLTSQIATLDHEIDSINHKLEALELRLRSQNSRIAGLTQPRPAGAGEIQQQLDRDSLLLEYALGEKRSYVFAVTNDSIKGFQLDSRDKIEAVANKLVHALTARNRKVAGETPLQSNAREDQADKDYAEAAHQLSKMVIEPVASLLGQKRLVIVADGALQYVPFSALPISEPLAQGRNSQTAAASTSARKTLNADHEIISLPSASVLALQRRELAARKPAPLKLAVLADPVFDLQDPRVATALAKPNRNRNRQNTTAATPTPSQNTTSKTDNSTLFSALRDVGLNSDGTLRRLVLSRSEATDIARLIPPKESLKALDFKASRATAISGELSKYQYVHFATHGLLSLEHPELSGIALSMVDEKGQKQDGYLRLYEIYNLDLPAELVVLSACETGVGKQVRGEGLIALTRGFMYAGAKRVVASLWKVDDSATASLMAQFYKEMFANGRTPAAALKEAQRHMSEQKRWRSPYFWAGFVLQGEWR